MEYLKLLLLVVVVVLSVITLWKVQKCCGKEGYIDTCGSFPIKPALDCDVLDKYATVLSKIYETMLNTGDRLIIPPYPINVQCDDNATRLWNNYIHDLNRYYQCKLNMRNQSKDVSCIWRWGC